MYSKRKLLLLLFLFGIYSRMHLNIGGVLVPYILCLLSSVGLLFLNYGRLKIDGVKYFFLFTLLNIVLSFFSYLAVGYNVTEVIKSLLLFEYSIFFGLIFYDEICRWNRKDLADLFKFTVYLIFALCILDMFTPFNYLNQQFQVLLGKGANLQAVSRDLEYHGGLIRPFPFTSEPSHVAKYLIIAIPAWFMLKQDRNYTKFFFLSFLAFAIVRSPILAANFILGVFYLLKDRRFKKELVRYFLIRLSIVLLGVLMAVLSYQLMGGRILNIFRGGDLSFIFRIVRPVLVLQQALLESPIVGVGAGNTEQLVQLYSENYEFWMNQTFGEGYTISALYAPLAFFGIAGSLFHFLLLRNLVKSRIKRFSLFLFLIHVGLISLSMGAFLSVNYWAFIFIIFRIYGYERR